jgi:hypothetical protein
MIELVMSHAAQPQALYKRQLICHVTSKEIQLAPHYQIFPICFITLRQVDKMSIHPNFMIEAASFDSPHFSFDDPYLKIKTSDADGSQRPPATDMILHPGHPDCDKKILDWKKKLGRILVQEYLAIGIGTEGAHLPWRNKAQLADFAWIKGVKDYQLLDFPEGYTFYMQRRTPRGTGDGYLLGAGRRFRSPQEFLFHAAWLMDGMPKSRGHNSDHSSSQDGDDDHGCICKYCSGQPQKELNEKMKKRLRKIKERLQKEMRAGSVIHRGINVTNKFAFRTPILQKSRRRAPRDSTNSRQGSSSDEVFHAVTNDSD